MENKNYSDNNELNNICNEARELIKQKKYHECRRLVINSIGRYPHAPEPHNLMGILLENEGDHLTAMKHFRAACALDPTYLPTRFNLVQYSDFFCKTRKDAFDETDCPKELNRNLYKVEYDERGIGHIIKRN